MWYSIIQENNTLTCSVQRSATKITSSIKAVVALKVGASVTNTLWSAQSCVNNFEKKWCVYNLQCSFESGDNGEKPCILTSRSHCLHVYSHSVEQNTFNLPDRHKTHTYHLPLSTSQPLNLNFCLFRQCFYWLSFFNEKLVSSYAFYGLQNAAYNNVFNINVQDLWFNDCLFCLFLYC